MTVYKYFLKVALENRKSIMAYIIIFFVMSLLFGAGVSQKKGGFIETKLDIGIIDYSNDELSIELKKYLGEKNNIVDTKEDLEYIREQIFLEMADAIIIIPKNFREKVVNKENAIEIYNDERKMETIGIQNQINKFLIFANATYENGKFNLVDVNLALNEKINVELIDNKTVRNISINEWFKNYFNFTSYVILGMYISIIGVVMADFRNEDIEKRMKISSKEFLSFNKEMYLGQLTIAFMITLVFIFGSIIFKGKYIGEVDFAKYVINTTVLSFTILCFTFFINSFTKNKFVITALSTALSLGISFISGVMVPQEFLGEKTLAVAKFFPNYYFVKINNMTVNSFSDMKFDLFMQLLFAPAFILLGLYFSKVKQKTA